ncbi:uncharacterized protein BO87DRAFT_74209 [Aspergillus neoniger CBS 115656]|uniref:Uncharacterized protein n=1 Tax=Aspergillus neoniger (strain CBS 115656) TaxID=1448310 RepID=A0A318YXM5_ASPNB|nr:hypothetical protein BO87DRAFT_74209 [Aspergillus neoniger CBS 115656]PYH38944.1 hypothetical protein BO87DRAFT_74209 [Aspergillus neoniger CBS 115656]
MCGSGDIISWEGGSLAIESKSCFFERVINYPLTFCGPVHLLTSSLSHQHHDSFFLSYLFIYSVLRFPYLASIVHASHYSRGWSHNPLTILVIRGWSRQKEFFFSFFVFHLRKCSKAYPIMLVFGFASGSTRSGLCASSCLCLS